MKLEQLATLLKKDATELASTLNLQNSTDEVPGDQLQTVLSDHIKLIEVAALSEGKKQGEGKAKREVLTNAEKLLKERFEVDGNNFDEIVEALSGKVGKVEIKADDKVVKERDAWKQKATELANEVEKVKSEFERIGVITQVKQKLSPVMSKFQFPTEKVKEIALQQFTEGKEFLISDDSIFVMQNGKPVGTFDQLAEQHFSEYAPKIEPKSNTPPHRTQHDSVSFGGNVKELMTSLRAAKTPEERSSILEQLKKLDATAV